MLLNRIKKLIVVALVALFILPALNVKISSVSASEYDATLYLGLNYEYEINDDEISKAKLDDIIISIKNIDKVDGDYVEVYKDKKDLLDGDNFKVSFSTKTTTSSAKVSLIAREVGVFEVKVSLKEKSNTKIFTIKVVDDMDKEALTPSYSNNEEALNDFKAEILENIKSDGETATLVAGETFTLPSLKKLIETVVPYENLKKTLYYAAPNSTSYQSTTFTKADATFKISTYGTYRFYVTMYVEKIDKYKDGILLGTEFLEEKEDGFYKIYDLENNKLYAKKVNNEYKYYTDEKCETEHDGGVKTSTYPIIPIFTFTLENAGPSIKIESQYQENGYVGLEYTIDGITVSGNDVQTTYKLEYKKDSSSDWEVAEEEFDLDALAFTPTKIGQYRVYVIATDATGKSIPNDGYIIQVDEKYTTVNYKVSFGDWLEVNTVPFIFLCVSGVCLIAIILLLVINPKEKVASTKEEDR